MKIFSLEEANRLIPVLESLLRDFQVKIRKMEESMLQAELLSRKFSGPAPQGQSRRSREEISHLEHELTDILKLINQVGCVIRDPRQGLIDFPSIQNKEPVYLCWKLGEDHVSYFHSVDGGFSARKPL